VLTLTRDHPLTNNTALKGEHFAGWVAERLITLLAHLRRMQDRVRFKQGMHRLNADDQQRLEALVKMVQPRECEPFPGCSSRRLTCKVSDVSVDAEGFPKCLSAGASGEVPGTKAVDASIKAVPAKSASSRSKSDWQALCASQFPELLGLPEPPACSMGPSRGNPQSKPKPVHKDTAKGDPQATSAKGWTLKWEATRNQWLCRAPFSGPGSSKTFSAQKYGGSKIYAHQVAQEWLQNQS
jgi:hypothetical protein